MSLTMRIRLRHPVALALMLPLLASACGEGSPTGPGKEIQGLPRPLSQTEERLIEAGSDFAFRFLKQVYGSAPDTSVFLAPLSASMALGMTMNGTAGATFEEMRQVLGFGSMSLDQINVGYRDLMRLLLELDPKVEVGIGNSIWYRQGFPVRADFLDRTKLFFDARASALNFADPGAAGIINGWVRDQTRGKIEEIVDSPIDPATVMFLINAVYFKGIWTSQFDKKKTVQASFTGRSGDTAPVPLMQLTDTLRYAETDSYQAVDLPYGGKAFSMTVILPKAGHEMEDLVASLSPAVWNQIVAGLQRREGTVSLPRFRMEWEKILNETLQAMGMNLPFIGGEADFSGLSDEALARGLYISRVRQKTYVDVDEEGTEAAGVTSVEIRETSMPDRFTFRADRPFLFVIRERFSGTILFAGVLVEPPPA
jgi:serine protease inhibitor